jgi:hypothetical protein
VLFGLFRRATPPVLSRHSLAVSVGFCRPDMPVSLNKGGYVPDEAFLEQYPLYRRFAVENLPQTMDRLPKVRIKMACPTCKSDQTFAMTNQYWENHKAMNVTVAGEVFRMVYRCSHCDSFERVFFVKADHDGKWLMKVGQFPAWEISTDAEIERLLGGHSPLFKKGLVCESQGYGIGAFGYYRRIVEEVIDLLLDEIASLMGESERPVYQAALAQTKKTTVTQEKIDLVKDLLPPVLRPDEMNPLSVLHSALSAGLHAGTDDECLEQAAIARDVLVFLVNQVAATRAASRSFTESMRKLLDKKAAKSS